NGLPKGRARRQGLGRRRFLASSRVPSRTTATGLEKCQSASLAASHFRKAAGMDFPSAGSGGGFPLG
ncbi:MAG: hypothetical protein RSC91_09685, partial [Clostridia bacterium]